MEYKSCSLTESEIMLLSVLTALGIDSHWVATRPIRVFCIDYHFLCFGATPRGKTETHALQK